MLLEYGKYEALGIEDHRWGLVGLLLMELACDMEQRKTWHVAEGLVWRAGVGTGNRYQGYNEMDIQKSKNSDVKLSLFCLNQKC